MRSPGQRLRPDDEKGTEPTPPEPPPLRACCSPQPQHPAGPNIETNIENAPFCPFLGRFRHFARKPEELHPRNVRARIWAVLWIFGKTEQPQGPTFSKLETVREPPTIRRNVADKSALPPRNIGRLNRGPNIKISGVLNVKCKECNCNTNCRAVIAFSVPVEAIPRRGRFGRAIARA